MNPLVGLPRKQKRFVDALLKSLMERDGLTGHQLAERLGVSYPHVKNLLNKTRPAGEQTLDSISKAFDIPLVRLLGAADEALPSAGTVTAKGPSPLQRGC